MNWNSCSEKLKNIQLVLGEYNMYNDREEFSEQKYKLKRKIVHPKVKEECVLLTMMCVTRALSLVRGCVPGE